MCAEGTIISYGIPHPDSPELYPQKPNTPQSKPQHPEIFKENFKAKPETENYAKPKATSTLKSLQSKNKNSNQP